LQEQNLLLKVDLFMKTLVRNGSNVSLYIFSDEESVTVTDTNVVVGDPERLIIGDCNSSNVTLFTGVTNPEAWQGWKYLYTDADGWTANPTYSE
tara:strand:+ start:2858 stop:3139 length:282 start_codon:yes stop_codon:yes gene_type:complete